MAAAAERDEPTRAIRSDTHGGRTRSLAADASACLGCTDPMAGFQMFELTTMKEEAMHCPTCHCAMVSTSSQAFEDEKGTMTITRWRCRPCHETAEEIWLSAGYCGLNPARIRYAVASRPAPQVTVAARAGAKRGTYAYAGTI